MKSRITINFIRGTAPLVFWKEGPLLHSLLTCSKLSACSKADYI